MKRSPHSPAGDGAVADARLETLVSDHRAYIREIVSRLVPKHLGVQQSEIEQETTIRLWRSLRNQKEIRDFRSYVYRVAATAALDAIREIKRRREEPLDLEGLGSIEQASSLSPEAALAQRALIHRVQQLVGELPDNRRRAVKLHLQGFTSEEIGRRCGWTEAKARNLIYRGLAALREKLRAAGIDDAD